jgi:hypothetical protein
MLREIRQQYSQESSNRFFERLSSWTRNPAEQVGNFAEFTF